MLTFGIETSCDETSAAVVEDGQYVLSNAIRSSLDLHKKYGGVVPEIAAREHIKIILPVIDKALKDANIVWDQIDQIAVTKTPGLIGSLLVGINTAEVISEIKKIPLIEVNHIHGHIYSNFLTMTDRLYHPNFPVLVLTVSGGHNEIILMKNHYDFQVIGESIDDAAGEAFDKVAKILGLAYPGGPSISNAAKKGNKDAFSFPRPLMNSGDYNFSFSGLKTAVMYAYKDIKDKSNKIVYDFSASFQEAVCDVLADKFIRAAKEYQVNELHLAGGVSANTRLREVITKKSSGLPLKVPESIKLCTDNAAMIAAAGYFKTI